MSLSDSVYWAELRPIDPVTGFPVIIRLTTENSSLATGIDVGNGEWMPYLISQPDIDIQAFIGEFDGASSSGISNLEATNTIKNGEPFAKDFHSYVWDGTPAVVYKGTRSTSSLGSSETVFTGVSTGTPEVSLDTIKFRIRDLSSILDVDFPMQTYAGTGGLEGSAEQEGVFKPLMVGSPLNVEPILIDAVNLVYQYSGYGPTGGVVALWENGLNYGASTAVVPFSVNDATTYANLISEPLQPGQWADCPSLGCFRLGGEPVANGVITVDAIGDSGAVNDRIDTVISFLLSEAGFSSYVDGSSFGTVYADSGNQTLSDYFNLPFNLASKIADYMSQVGGTYSFNSEGFIRFGLIRMGSPALEIRSDGTSEPVAEEVNLLSTSAPYKRVRIGADKVYRVHGINEISDALLQEINDLTSQIQDAAGQLANAADDQVLTAQEKIQIVLPTDNLYFEQYTELGSRALVLGISTAALDSAYTSYLSSRNAISPAWNDTSQNSSLSGNSFRSDSITLADELVRIARLISEEDAKLADWPNVRDSDPNSPADNATEGATWGSDISGQPTDEELLNEINRFRVSVKGSGSTTHPLTTGLRNSDGTAVAGAGAGRSYNVSVWDRASRSWSSHNTYDVFLSTANATAMASLLNSLDSSKIVVIYTNDEPQTNRLSGGLDEAMYRCGASRAVFGTSNDYFKFHSAYILIGIPGMGEGNGNEFYNGEVDSDADAWLDVTVTMRLGGTDFGGNTPPVIGGFEEMADVTKSLSGPASINFAFDSDGVIKAGQVGARGVFSLVTSQDVVITSGVSWAVSVVSGTYSAASPTMSGTGTAQINFSSEAVTPGRIRVTATTNSGQPNERVYTRDVDITITQDDPPVSSGGGGGGGTTTTGTANGTIPSGSAWATVYSGLVNTASGIDNVNLTANNLFLDPTFPYPSPTVSANIEGQWERETTPGSGTWTSLGSPVSSSPDPGVFDEGGFGSPSAGAITVNFTDTGRSPDTQYSYRLRMRANPSSTFSVSCTGSVSLNGET